MEGNLCDAQLDWCKLERIDENLSQNVKTLLVLREMSVKDAATISGLSVQAIYHVMNVERWPNPDTLMRLAKAFRVTVPQLLAPPVALEKPDLLAAFQTVSAFFRALTPVRTRLVEVAASLDDDQAARYLAMMELEIAHPATPDSQSTEHKKKS